MNEAKRTTQLQRRANNLMSKERWLEAVKLLKDNQSIVQKDWRLSWDLGWCHSKLEQLDEAKKHMIRAKRLAPEKAACTLGLGFVYVQMEQFKKAEVNFAESLRIKDTYITRISLAFAYLAQGKLAEAEDVHLAGINFKPNECLRYEAYADFLSDVGREAEAIEMRRKAKKITRIN